MAYVPTPGDIVPVSKSPGYIVLSYLVSYVGCLTALELLRRRTHHGGHFNWFLLGGAATAMGGVAIWYRFYSTCLKLSNFDNRSMHYIGMQAMVMGNGEDELQLYYYASYTAGSFFLPIAVVTLSFFVFSSSLEASVWRIAIAGIFCGAAICGMHYLGQVGIVNYDDVWNWRYIFASVIIAMSAATIALGVFFYLSSKWINALWKRALCASLLAGAVCLMHWTAILGTSFRWKGSNTSLPPGPSKIGAVWVCGALAVSCCLVLLVLAVIFQYIRRKYTEKAQQISLALAYFAPDGSIMLDTGGHLPLNKITGNYLRVSTKDNFDVDTALFAWMYKASRNWACVDGLISSMRLHIQLEQGAEDVSIASVNSAKPYSYSTILKELYCIAAEDLAHAVGFQISQVGFLFDRILNTGRMASYVRTFNQPTPTIGTGSDSECSPGAIPTTLTRGQVLFLIRHLNPLEVTYLQTLGCSFVPLKSVVASIAASMHITSEELRPYLDDLAAYKEMPRMLDAGVHLAMFIVRPVIGGFEILAKRTVRNQLPSIALPMKKLESWQVLLLTQYNNWEASALLAYWSLEPTRRALTVEQHNFISYMCDAMTHLQNRVGEKIFDKARFVAKPLSDPGKEEDVLGAGTATILAFKCITDIHYIHPAVSLDTFINARLFTAQQHCYPGSSDHAIFSGRVHKEFASVPGIANRSPQYETGEELSSEYWKKLLKEPLFIPGVLKHDKSADISPELDSRDEIEPISPAGSNRPTSISTIGDYRHSRELVNPDLISEQPPIQIPPPPITRTMTDPLPQPKGRKPQSSFARGGGVHVSNEIHITVADAETASTDMIEMGKLGMKTEIGTVRERESAVDILMALTLGGLRN